MVRYAARIALEHQSSDSWTSRLATETDSRPIIEGTIALVRSAGNSDDQKRSARKTFDAAINKIAWNDLDLDKKLCFIRAIDLAICRLGKPSQQILSTAEKLVDVFPTGDRQLDRELAKLLVATGNSSATEKVVQLLETSPGKLDQIDLALTLIDAKAGWTKELREQYFEWFSKIASAKGGNSFGGYVSSIRKKAIGKLNGEQKSDLAEVLERAKNTAKAAKVQPVPVSYTHLTLPTKA